MFQAKTLIAGLAVLLAIVGISSLTTVFQPGSVAELPPITQVAQVTSYADLSVDPSSPPTVKSNAQNLTSATFTPPAGSVIYVTVGINSNTTPANDVTNVTSNTGLTFSRVATYGSANNQTRVYLYTAPVTTSQAMTVTASQAVGGVGYSQAMMNVVVVNGADVSAPVGAKGGGTQAGSATLNTSYTSTRDKSLGYLVYGDWNNAGTPTVGSGQTVVDSYNVSGEDTYALIKRTSVTSSSGTQVPFNLTIPSTNNTVSYLYFEILPKTQIVANQAPKLVIPLYVSNLTANSVTINWTTDVEATSQVRYGLTSALGSQTQQSSSLTKNHSVTLTGLNPNSVYYFQIVSSNSAGTYTDSVRSILTSSTLVNVTSPVTASETWELGQTYPITWTSDPSLGSDYNVAVYAQSRTNMGYSIITSGLLNNGSAEVTIPTTLQTGDYNISVRVRTGQGVHSATSPTVVTLTGTTQPNTPSLYYLSVQKMTNMGNGVGTISANIPDGECGTTCNSRTFAIPVGQTVTLTATPASGSVFGGWVGSCDPKNATNLGVTVNGNTCTLTMNSNHSAGVVFQSSGTPTAVTYPLYLTKVGKGTITSNIGFTCGSACQSSVNNIAKDATVTLTITPDSGYKFRYWDGQVCSKSTNTSCSFTMTKDMSVTAYLDVVNPVVTIVKNGTGSGTVKSSGSINCGSRCSSSGVNGQTVNLTATPASGSVFKGWSGVPNCSTASTCSFTLTNNITVTATFDKVNTPPTVSLSSSPTSGTVPFTVNLTASASDTDGTISKVEFYRGTSLIATDTSSPYTTTNSITTAATYSFTAKAYDNSGAVTTSGSVAVTAIDPSSVDGEAPTAPSGLTATAVSSSQINLSWTASTDNVGVLGYRIYRSGTYLASVNGTTFSNLGLVANSTYYYTVTAYDQAGNESAQSNQASAKTQEDTTPPPSGSTVTATSCSTSDVQAAINAVDNGGTVLIPNGSCSWSSGVTMGSKRVMIKAQNASPVKGGRTNQSVVITNNASVPLFTLTTGNDYHTGISGIRFNEGSRTSNYIFASGSGSKVALLSDLYVEGNEKFGTAPAVATIRWEAQGGVWWNMYFYGLRDTNNYGGELAWIANPRAWETASTMGTLDTNGNVNLYIEDSSFVKTANSLDFDPRARAVVRYSSFNCSNMTHHGLTSGAGARHTEWYNNTFSNTFSNCNIGARYLWVRGGTTLMTNNVVNNATYSSDYGSPTQLTIGEHDDNYGTYPPTQTSSSRFMPGWGHNGTSFVSDPIYIWNNTGARANTYGYVSSYWSGMTALNRDLFVGTAKPGWAPYTYPHPARGEGTGNAITASSCSQSDVQTAINSASDGDTVIIPAGDCTWSQQVNVNKGIKLLGSGIDVTTLRDNVTKNGSGSSSLLSVSVSAPSKFEVANFTLIGVATDPNIYNKGHLALSGTSKAFRVHHIKVLTPKTSFIMTSGDLWGVIDNVDVTTDSGAGLGGISVSHNNWGGSQYGDGSWADDLYPGTEKAIYIENSKFTNLSDTQQFNAMDCYQGGRAVFRYNTLVRSNTTSHGADSGQRQRGCRWQEIYNNTYGGYPNTAGYGVDFIAWTRGGTSVMFNNTITNIPWLNSVMKASNLRDSTSYPVWGLCNGSSPYDQNQSGQTGYRCVDQPGAGKSNHLNGLATPTSGWVGNILEPFYVWNNTVNGSSNNKVGGSTHVQSGRDFYSGTARPGYTPYVCPHPLAVGSTCK